MIGVVVPCLDGERYLGEALESIAAQTHPVAEIVFVDDGSTDRSVEIATRFGARVVRTPAPRSGAAVARDAGFAALATPLVAFLDADDRWLPRKLEVQHALLDRDPGADGVIGGVRQFISEDRSDLEGRIGYGDSTREAYMFGALLIRREAYIRAGGSGTDVGMADTLDFFRRVRASLRIEVADEVVYERRVHGDNSTLSAPAQLHADYLRAARRAILDSRHRA